MCGLAAIFAPQEILMHRTDTMQKMLNRIAHRGPDRESVHKVYDQVLLGHRRFLSESTYYADSTEFFKEGWQVYIDDCFAEKFELRTIPISREGKTLHHLGCEIGF